MKHIETKMLWIQGRLARGDFRLPKVGADENLADGLTKYVDGRKLDYHLRGVGYLVQSGRHEIAPKLD